MSGDLVGQLTRLVELNTVSPSSEALIPAWMVSWSSGTLSMSDCAAPAHSTIKVAIAIIAFVKE